jgi:hypothetical protein
MGLKKCSKQCIFTTQLIRKIDSRALAAITGDDCEFGTLATDDF